MPSRATKSPSAKKSAARKPAVRRPTARKTVVRPTAEAVEPKIVKAVQRTYTFAVGRRKQAVARVRLTPGGQGDITVNNRPIASYFPGFELQHTVRGPLVVAHQENTGTISAHVAGGGTQGQADAVRLGIARALVKIDPDLRIPLKRAGYLRRDPRVKERKKYGLRRARRAPQWQKRDRKSVV